MRVFTINKTVTVAADTDKTWEFIQNPVNLNLVTPDNIEFRIVSDPPDKMYNGLTIAYRIKLPVIGLTDWLTEIKHVRSPFSFVDEQRIGPYKFWSHYHEVKPSENGTQIIDKVHYVLPVGFISKIIHVLFIRRMLLKIFDFRNQRFKELLEVDPNKETS